MIRGWLDYRYFDIGFDSEEEIVHANLDSVVLGEERPRIIEVIYVGDHEIEDGDEVVECHPDLHLVGVKRRIPNFAMIPVGINWKRARAWGYTPYKGQTEWVEAANDRLCMESQRKGLHR